MVVQSGNRKLAIVGMDLVKIRHDLADAASAQASQRTEIARDAVLICPSHNHRSPLIPACCATGVRCATARFRSTTA